MPVISRGRCQGRIKLPLLRAPITPTWGDRWCYWTPGEPDWTPNQARILWIPSKAHTGNLFSGSPGWPSSYFHSPWPLSEDRYLVSFSFDPLPGMGPKEERDSRTGLYYFDRWGNLELLYDDPKISCMYPIPWAPASSRPSYPDVADSTLGDEGELMLADVNHSLTPLPPSRKVTQLRVFQVLPKTGSHVANQPRLVTRTPKAPACSWVPCPWRRMVRPISAPPPANLYTCRPLMPRDGRCKACAAYFTCSRVKGAVAWDAMNRRPPPPGYRKTSSQARPPSRIEPGPDGSHPMSYMRLIQPILNSRCVSCHSEANPGTKVNLTSAAEEPFVKSYLSLRPYIRWHEWGDHSISQIATRPGHMGADESKLVSILSDANHGSKIALNDVEQQAIYLWLDANAPFYGAYLPEEQLAQRKGEAIAPPVIQ